MLGEEASSSAPRASGSLSEDGSQGAGDLLPPGGKTIVKHDSGSSVSHEPY